MKVRKYRSIQGLQGFAFLGAVDGLAYDHKKD